MVNQHIGSGEVVLVPARAAQARQVSASLCKLSVELKNTTFQHQREARTAVERTFENKVEKNAALKAQLEHARAIVMEEYALVVEKEKSLVEFLAAQKSAVAKSVELRAVRATERPPKERTDDPAQVMFTRWTTVHHANIQSVQKLIMGCQADQKALLDAQRKIERDLGEKVMAMGLDAAAFASADGAATPYYAPPSTVGTPMTMGKWVKNTDEMCAVAQRVVENGQRLRHLCGLKVEEHTLSVQKVMKQVLKEIRKNMKATDGLIQGLEETIKATASKVEETEATVGELEAALHDKYPNMELAKHRFTARTYGSNPTPERPQSELMADLVHQSLRNEYNYLDRASQLLYDRIQQVHMEVEFLKKTVVQLQDDLADKKAHVAVDGKVEAELCGM